MKDQVEVPRNILLIGDNQQHCAEIAGMLENSPLNISNLEVSKVNVFCREAFDAAEFSTVILSIDGEKKTAIEHFSQSEFSNIPLLIISTSELISKTQDKISGNCRDSFLREEITPSLLACSIRHLGDNASLQKNLHENEIRFGAVLETMNDGVIDCDADGIIEFMNPVVREMFLINDSKAGEIPLEKFLPEFKQIGLPRFFRETSNAKNEGQARREFQVETLGMRVDGSLFPLELSVRKFGHTSRSKFICIVRDLTALKQIEEELQLAATAFETHTAILITNVDGSILRVNPAFTQITGYSAEEAVGSNPKMLRSGHHGTDFYEKFWDSIKSTGKWEGEIWNKRKNGEIYPEWQTITAVKNSAGKVTHYVATFQDITERKETQALIEHHAFYDALTNLPNRRMMLDRLNQELSAARRHKIYGALLFLDLDHFKNLNDSMGHAVGDSLLQQMAKRLSNNVRIEDTVSRLGGDEFVVLLSNLGPDEQAATATTKAIAQKIHKSISRPYQLEGHSFNFTSSIGITLYPFANDTADDVLKHADAAMYRAKGQGRNAICFYQSSMQAEADQRLQLEKQLRNAIDNEELVLYYQPQFSNEKGIIGAEALLRWSHPERGIVEPKDFISLAEETNLIQPIGVWVVKNAVKQYAAWLENGLFTGKEYIAVNISPKQIQQEDFVNIISSVLEQYDVPPNSLKLELTESVLLNDLQDVVIKMERLTQLGVSFSMDDFGTGFSSLSYLKRLPFDQIKIDKTFIRDVPRDINDAAIVETIIAMADHLNLDVIAEGVETQEEFDFLQGKGCFRYQGFYFSTPLQASSFEQTLRNLVEQDQSAANAS